MLQKSVNSASIICLVIAIIGGAFVFLMKEPQTGVIDFPVPTEDTIGIYHSPDGALSWEQIQKLDSQRFFIPAQEELPGLLSKDSSGAVSTWVRIPLENNSGEEKSVCLEIGTKWIDLAQLYSPQEDGSYTIQKTGESIDYSEKTIPTRRPAFKINLEPRSQTVHYLLLKEFNHTFAPIIKLWNSPEDFNHMILTENRRVSIHFGIYCPIFLFSIIAYLVIQSRDLLYYLIYILLSGIIQINIFSLYDVVYPFTLLDSVWFSDAFFPMQALASGIFVLFTLRFLETSKQFPRIEKVLRFFTWLYILIMPVLNLGMFGIPPLVGFSSVFYGGLVLTLVCFMVAIAGIYNGSSQAYFYATAYLIYTVNQYRLFFACIIHIEPASILTVQWLYGFSLEMMVLTVALSERFLNIKNQKEYAEKKAYTEAKAFNQLQQSYTESLLQEVENQTTELQQENKRKDQLFQIVGKNLRNPLGKIANLSSSITYISPSESSNTFRLKLQNIWLNSLNLLNHLENLLNWARLKVEALPCNSQKYNLVNIVESTLQKYQPFTQENRARFHLKIDKKIFVHVDLNHVNIILRNLIAYTITDKRRLNHINISALKHNAHIRLMIEYTPIDSINHPEVEDTKYYNSPKRHFSIQLCQQLLDLYDSELVYQNASQNLSLFEFKLNAA